ncbi:MAG: hypothetical protein WBL61_25645 [Bryobacteraceae bacterium]
MPLNFKRSPAEGEFLFEIDEQPTKECLTALGGLPLLVRTARSLDVPGSVKRNLALKQRDRGFDEATYVESFFSIWRWQRSAALRGTNEAVGLAAETAVGMAPRKGGHD